jgi:hypothetical protein
MSEEKHYQKVEAEDTSNFNETTQVTEVVKQPDPVVEGEFEANAFGLPIRPQTAKQPEPSSSIELSDLSLAIPYNDVQ